VGRNDGVSVLQAHDHFRSRRGVRDLAMDSERKGEPPPPGLAISLKLHRPLEGRLGRRLKRIAVFVFVVHVHDEAQEMCG
jgi:hypothetical protein